ncbi:tRNA pseudouridine(38-40) synthase TruA [Blochmannia endosymbiont of Camponotus (Colobopsis) obliquus]|uniref:tRNA pseudouridine(38-40) synthase TruA n=1 Tax=Blochmannia endosymbiont of Camponotus (Colobopsis) obliquus TaxID=1505597 RepID=UPI00061A7251|nr:tRNA pseudouridine(38-40) synthase TruA [Blochmannia endosymbiont of Camponotus (Colobopsis) obliquus]AKC60648.1 tRNA pseudouridine synthase A [Blochmannia endosymbiont of Camponotus (Colobopsis) obliquus]
MAIKIVLCIEYDGSNYHGWQRQPCLPSVQQSLEEALSQIASEKIVVVCAGRTDAKVHAVGQVVHFETTSCRPKSAWTLGVNSYLPSNIVVHWSAIVNQDFHARFSALSRRYYYIIYNHDIRPAILHKKVTHCQKFLDVDKMFTSAQCLLGENDFNSFRSMHCQSRSSLRNLYHLYILKKKKYIIIDIEANAFMHHMVRKIVGSLMEVGFGHRPVNWIAELLYTRDRSLLSTIIAPPDGLYLFSVKYATMFNFPLEKDTTISFME